MAAELKARLTLNNSQFMRGLQGSLASGKRFGAQLASAGFGVAQAGMAALTVATVAAGAALAVGVKRAYDLGGSLSDISARTGVAADRLVVLQRVFANAGVSQDSLQTSFNRMQRALVEAQDGTNAAAKALQGMGVPLESLLALSPDEQFWKIGQAIQRIGSPAERAAAAMQIFGRSGAELLTVFADGREGLDLASREVGNQAKILGENASRFDSVSDRLGGVGLKLQGFFVGVAAQLLPQVERLLRSFERLDFSGLGRAVARGLLKAGDTFIGTIANPQQAIATLSSLMNGVMAMAGNKLLQALETSRNFFRDGFGSAVQGIGRILLASLLSSFSEATTYLQARIEAATNLLANPKRAKLLGERVFQERALEVAEADKTRFGGLIAGPAANRAEKAQNRLREIDSELARMDYSDLDVEAIASRIRSQGGPRVSMGAEGPMNADQLRASGLALLNRGIAATQAAPARDTFGAGASFTEFGSRMESLRGAGAGLRNSLMTPDPIRPRNLAENQLIGILGRERGEQVIRERRQGANPNDPSVNLLAQLLSKMDAVNGTLKEAFQ
jgi:hypothetical protein